MKIIFENYFFFILELKQFPEAKLRKIADCLEEESFENGHCIFKQGLSRKNYQHKKLSARGKRTNC